MNTDTLKWVGLSMTALGVSYLIANKIKRGGQVKYIQKAINTGYGQLELGGKTDTVFGSEFWKTAPQSSLESPLKMADYVKIIQDGSDDDIINVYKSLKNQAQSSQLAYLYKKEYSKEIKDQLADTAGTYLGGLMDVFTPISQGVKMQATIYSIMKNKPLK